MIATLHITIQDQKASFYYAGKQMPIKMKELPSDGAYVITGLLAQGKTRDGKFASMWINPTGMITISQVDKTEPATAKKSTSKKTSSTTKKKLAAATPFE